MDKDKDRQIILDLVRQYARNYHNDQIIKTGDRVNYAGRYYDENELVNLVDSSLDFWLTSGKYTKEFEKRLGDYLGVRYVSFVNSGSSANLLALSALCQKELSDRRLKKGDEVITTAASFPTTVNPIIQLGLVPVFCDIMIPEYNIDVSQLEQALTSRTKAIFIAHTMGNLFDISSIKSFCDAHDLWLIEDNCDSLGSKYADRYTGTFGHIATSSFYPSHHITTGEGGAVYTDDHTLHKIIRSLRDWGRGCYCEPGQDNSCGHRFYGRYGLLPEHYDHKYVYSHFGYNLKATDMQAAIGLAQMDKLDEIIDKRKHNHKYLYELLSGYDLDDKIILPEKTKDSDPSWFGFMICTKENIDTDALIEYLESNNIQTRKLFAGNILRQPCFDEIRDDHDSYRVVSDLSNTDYVMRHGFWVGIGPHLSDEAIEYIAMKINEGLTR